MLSQFIWCIASTVFDNTGCSQSQVIFAINTPKTIMTFQPSTPQKSPLFQLPWSHLAAMLAIIIGNQACLACMYVTFWMLGSHVIKQEMKKPPWSLCSAFTCPLFNKVLFCCWLPVYTRGQDYNINYHLILGTFDFHDIIQCLFNVGSCGSFL